MVRKNIPVNNKSNNLLTFGGRISAERQKLHLTIVDFAVRCGVTKQTQIKYESGDNFPDVRYLERADQLGVDVFYVLTGVRGVKGVTDEEQNLLEAYNNAPELVRLAVFGVLSCTFCEDIKKAKDVPGYYLHELVGDDELRYKSYYESTQTKETGADLSEINLEISTAQHVKSEYLPTNKKNIKL